MRSDIIERINEVLRALRARWLAVEENTGAVISKQLNPSYSAVRHILDIGQKLRASNWNALSEEVVVDLAVIEQYVIGLLNDIDKSNHMVSVGDTGMPSLIDDMKSRREERTILRSKTQGCSNCRVYRFAQPASRAVSPSNAGNMYIDWSSGEHFNSSDVASVIQTLNGSGVVVLPGSDENIPVASAEETYSNYSELGNIEVVSQGNICDVCDGKPSTLWVRRIANTTPISRFGISTCKMISRGIGLPEPGQHVFNRLFTRNNNNFKGHMKLGVPRDIVVRIISGGTINSGDVTFTSYHKGYIAQPMRCVSDGGLQCLLGLKKFYTNKCMNTSCPMYSATAITTVSDGNTFYELKDGYGNDTGYSIRFDNGSVTSDTFIPAGMTWLISTDVQRSGAAIELVCEIAASGKDDYIAISPAAGGFIIDDLTLYSADGAATTVVTNTRINRATRVWIASKGDYRTMRLRVRQDKYTVTTVQQEDTVQAGNTIKDSYLNISPNAVSNAIVNERVSGTPVEHGLLQHEKSRTGYVYEIPVREISTGKMRYLSRGMRVLQPITCKPVGEIRFAVEFDTPVGLLTSSTYEHARGASLELGARIVLKSLSGKAYRNIDIPIPLLQQFTLEGIANASVYTGIAGERLFVSDGVASLRFPIINPEYMIDTIDNVSELASGVGNIVSAGVGLKKIQTTTIYSPSAWDTDAFVGYHVLIDGSPSKSYEIVGNTSSSITFRDPLGTAAVDSEHFFRVGSVSSVYAAVNGNIACYNISRGRFVYPSEVSISIDRSGRAPIVRLEFIPSIASDVICASYIPERDVALTQDGTATLGYGRVFVEDVHDAMSADVYPILLLRGNPITNNETLMVKKVSVFVSEYER